jgi:hypothetical protein
VHRFAIPVLGLALAMALAACAAPSTECDALPDQIELTLSARALTPTDPAVCRDDDVTLIVRPEVDGILHIHGYDADVPATPVMAGEVLELAFTATRSGEFPIELHTDENTQGVNVGTFTVHEP